MHFPVSLTLLYNFIPYIWGRYFAWYLAFKIYLDLICSLTHDPPWKMSPVHLKMGILCCWVDVLYVCYIQLISMFFRSSTSSLIFCLVILFIILSRVLKSPTIILELSISSFNSISLCFLYLDGLLKSVWMLIIVFFALLNLLLIYNVFLCLF